ncbi:MAG: ATP-binding cassette domain-containing protein [Veillonella sp.]|uniref:energy-coupling factor ABC transporter ATP-binding protein n=1 Tax=Veillonella sp. TaxID=1926307 RepID=UPI0025FF8A05|nr:ABC transporter ATP-binding protein [Veillonella sp.]MBS4913143.1 ATP-binding cassette domain-containing protein [Veillonella sp.]
MERVTDVSKLVYTHMQGGQFRWVTVSTLMLALGTILHLVSPSVAGITPNWMIATYCVAIHLTRPSYKQALGIGLVAALINVMTSKSAFPYANLLSEPAGALTCAFVVHMLSRIKVGKFIIPPVVSGFLSTLVSGGIFITILFELLALPIDVYMKGMWPLVLVVALCNAVVTPLLYIPAQRLFARRGYLPSADEVITSDHSQYELVPAVNGKISIEHFTYHYGRQEKAAIKDVNLVVNDGDFLVITGPAGCGKSTLCMAMIGAVPKFYGGRMEGMVFVNGKATTQLEIAELATEIGVVLADYDTQLVTMTVGEEVAFAMENRGYTPEEIKERSAAVFKQVGLEGMENRKITSLSGGQRQRLAIASVLATNPSILVLDEPTSSLDPEGTDELYRLVGRLNKEYGITVVVIDHDLHAVLPYANRMALMVDGEIRCDDTPETTLRYMYDNNIYVDALPSIFVTYMRLEKGGYRFAQPWLSVNAAKDGLLDSVKSM